jgi:hypothetical protein
MEISALFLLEFFWLNSKKEMIFKVFSCQNEKKYKSPDPYNRFYHVAKNINGWLNICTLFLIYSRRFFIGMTTTVFTSSYG